MPRQTSISEAIHFEGIGMHSGRPAKVRIAGADPGAGYSFVRLDKKGARVLRARLEEVSSSELATSLGDGDDRVSTVEHLLAALSLLGIDNVRVELWGPEIPILDGSAAPFAARLREAGIVEQPADRRVLLIEKTIEVEDRGRRVCLRPSADLVFEYRIEFPHPAIGVQTARFSPGRDPEQEILFARTFGFWKDAGPLRSRGLALGAGLENAVVFGQDGVMNGEGLRFSNEPARHKILDAVGDLALLGAPLLASYSADKAGHELNLVLLRKLMADRSAFRFTSSKT